MQFTKMQGLGNDYVYVSRFTEQVTDPAAVARFVSDRHTGVGSDGLILIGPSDVADFRMEMFNADGSEGEMCGNGIRCVGKFVYDSGLTTETNITVETGAGIKTLWLQVEDGRVARVRVDMGSPILIPRDVPVDLPSDLYSETAVAAPITAAGQEWEFTAVSMGNPHAVIFVDQDPAELNLPEIGPQFENHPLFPNRINTEFVQVLSPTHLNMRVWERGSGETQACGTGACAVAVAGVLNGLTEPRATVTLLGGDLDIEWDRAANTVYMTGPATTVFHGTLEPFNA